MKTLLPILSIACIIAMYTGSSILYLNMNYYLSAFLMLSSILGTSFLIGLKTRQKESE